MLMLTQRLVGLYLAYQGRLMTKHGSKPGYVNIASCYFPKPGFGTAWFGVASFKHILNENPMKKKKD